MTAVQQPPAAGDTGLHWDVSNMVDSDLEEFEDDESNSAKLFERSRIRALAGKFCACKVFFVLRILQLQHCRNPTLIF